MTKEAIKERVLELRQKKEKDETLFVKNYYRILCDLIFDADFPTDNDARAMQVLSHFFETHKEGQQRLVEFIKKNGFASSLGTLNAWSAEFREEVDSRGDS